jgi:hypothetical protein
MIARGKVVKENEKRTMADSSSAPAAPQHQQRQHQQDHNNGRKRPRPKPNQDSRRGRPRRQPNLPKLPPKPSCVVCQTFESVQYKCPKCRVPYCSVVCCKQHKEICNNGVPPTDKPVESSISKLKSKSNYLPPDLLVQDPVTHGQRARKELEDNDDDDSLEEGWKITQEAMETMDRSDWLRKELKDGGLRQIIFRVMNASDKVEKHGRTPQEEELERTKANYPPFGNFMDKLLVLAGILERQQEDDEEELLPLGEWLQEQVDREELQQSLALKPIPRRTMPVFEPVENQESSSEDASDSDSSSESDSEEASSSGED